MWTKEQYLNWIETRGEAVEWKREDCVAADRFVKSEALKELRKKLKGFPKVVQDYVMLMTEAHYGSAETDMFLRDLECYKHPG